MARGRLISKTLGSSRRFAQLQKQAGKLYEFAQVLYIMLVVNADDFGRMSGDAFTVKHAMLPTSPRREDEFVAALTALHHVGLIDWYQHEGQEVIEVLCFDTHQPNLHKRAEKSRFPGNPGSSRKLAELPSELNLTQSNSTEPNRTALMRRSDDGFEAFWVAYPKKKSRTTAEKAWRKLAPSPELTQRILDAVAAQRNTPDWIKADGQFIPYAATWLNGRRWLDESDDCADMARASEFMRRYQAMHAKYRSGAMYLGDPEADTKEALQLVRAFDDARLDKIAAVFLQDEDDFAATGTRSLAKLRSRASDADERLRVKGL